MKLTISQIKGITTGAVRIQEQENGIHFYRFTKEQEDLYLKRNPEFYNKTFATSGVRLCFRTNSEKLALAVEALRCVGCSRTYFAFDIFVNGEKLDSLDNYSGVDYPEDYTPVLFPLGKFSKEFSLGAGEKTVCIHFPWAVNGILQELRLDEGATLQPMKPKKKLLCFGDSITQGFDALHPSCRYVAQLADFLGAQEHNKAIGGDLFFPELAASKEDFTPDYITVAYGTNDWAHCTRETFIRNCKGFFENLCATYPNTPIFAITPIWRKEMHEEKPCGPFLEVDTLIREQTAQCQNVTVIRGFEFLPPEKQYYGDLRCLHPNDQGFTRYFEGVAREIKGKV